MRSLEESISEVGREIKVRERCFPRWVDDGKIDATDAKDRLERLRAALHYLRTIADSTPGEGGV